MASKTERIAVNAAGLVQGIVMVTFPAASTILTSKSEYGLSSSHVPAPGRAGHRQQRPLSGASLSCYFTIRKARDSGISEQTARRRGSRRRLARRRRPAAP